MEKRLTLPAILNRPAFAEYITALHTCCDHAREAAECGRYKAAHGLFQTAINCFEQAQNLRGGDEDGKRREHLSTARSELDHCATLVYSDDVQIEVLLQHTEERVQVAQFLEQIAATPLKIKILALFLREPGLCLTSMEVATRIKESPDLTREGLEELHAASAINYCRHFALSDLCCLRPDSLSKTMQNQLEWLREALRYDGKFVRDFLNERSSH